MKIFRFHLLSLVHLPQSKAFLSCAFTQKNRKLARMLTSLGHTVFFYGSEGSDVVEYCAGQPGKLIFIETHKLADIAKDYGDGDNRYSIGYDFTSCDFRHDFNTARKPSTLKFNAACIAHINTVKKPDDFLLCSMGSYQKEIAAAVGLHLTCEPGIGYRGSVKGWYRAFESSFMQSFAYGSENPFACMNGSYYDRVIPNYFDPDEMEFSAETDDYYLYIGRMIKRKGILTAALACNAIGKKLIIAGQGATVHPDGHLRPNDHSDFDLPPGTWEYVGYADLEKRKKLMSRAIATFTPTEYLECFAGTHVESMLHGTPPITTNFGVFPGTIPDCVDGKIGFKCNTLRDFVEAALMAKRVDRREVYQYGKRFLMDEVKWEFQKWFEDLHRVWQSIAIPGAKGWHYLPGK